MIGVSPRSLSEESVTLSRAVLEVLSIACLPMFIANNKAPLHLDLHH